MITPDGKPQAWEHATTEERIEACRQMLVIHGFLSAAESASVAERIAKWKQNHARRKRKAADPIPTMRRQR